MPLARLEASSRASAAIVFLAILALAMAFFGSGNLPARTSATPVVVGPVSAAAAVQPRNLTFYMHNSTAAKNVNGINTPYVFDTLQRFGKNNTITNVQSVVEDWYLYPALAGDLVVNGSIQLTAFVSVEGAAPSLQSQILSLYEINSTGAPTLIVGPVTFPAQTTWYNTPHPLILTVPGVHLTVPARDSLRVVIDLQLGTRTGTLWYNASYVPTQLLIQSDTFAQVHSLAFLDHTGTPRQNFDPLAANKTITIQANVTDPLGGYDIHWVNFTLVAPGGGVVLNDVPMPQVSGTPISYASLYQLTWNYTGAATGRYNASASVVDQSGYYHFLEAFSTAGFVDTLDSFFYVGGLPVYVNVQVVDSKNANLVGAQVTLVSGGVALDVETSGSSGIANFTMAKGEYTFHVSWQQIAVGSLVYNASANVSAGSPVTITTAVYYPDFQAQDANGVALADASILFVHPNGSKLGPYKTNATGDVLLSQVPVGTYGLQVSWRGVDVYSGSAPVSSNSVIAFKTAVFELTVTAKDANGAVLPGAFISVVDSTGLVFDAGVTTASGTVTLRLPAGNYTIDARYITVESGTLYDSGVRTQAVSLSSSTSATITFSDFPLPFTSTLAFVFALVYAVTIAAFVVILYLMRRRGGSKPAKEPAPPETKP